MKTFLAFILLLAVVVGGAGAWIYRGIRQPFRGYTGAEQFVDVPSGLATKAIGERLVSAGVVRDHLTFRAALWTVGQTTRLKAGEYRFTDPMTPLDVIDKLRRGDVFVIPTTFPEGLNVVEMSKIFESKGFGSAQSFVDAGRRLEGYLFPDTYALSRHTDAPRLVRLMNEAFERALTADIRAAAVERGLSVAQLVTLASIVEKETGNPSERPLVASVYENRLRIGMALQCDPTVIYALELAGRYDGNIRRDDLTIDSPYNTYRYPGLPPGPIASPGRASLDAVVHPADSEFLYFVSRNDGTHMFAKTLAEHAKNVQKYQVDFFKAGKAGGAGKAPIASPSSASRATPRSSSASRGESGASAPARGRR
jgi:peptidoglycan lytic transglycosylase G